MFGFFKKKKILLKDEMITPLGQPISTADAKRIFKTFMKETGYLDKDELSLHADYLSDEIRDHADYLKGCAQDANQDVSEAKKQLKTLRSKIKSVSDDSKQDIENEIANLEDDLVIFEEDKKNASEELADFKKDKKLFLIEYVNRQVGG